MHENLHENLWGVRTAYGTHPKQPTRLGIRLGRAARTTAVAVLAAWYIMRPPTAASE